LASKGIKSFHGRRISARQPYDSTPFRSYARSFFAELADKHGGEVAAIHPDQLGMMITEPYGVAAAIVP